MAFVLAPTNELLLHFKDASGKHATMRFNILNTQTDPAAGAAAAISNAAQTLSESALYETEILIVGIDPSPGSPTTGPYDRPSDKAAFKVKWSDGSHSTLQIGAPVSSDFSNAWDVDFTDPGIVNLVAALQANAKSAGGAAYVAVTQGQRRRPSRRKTQ